MIRGFYPGVLAGFIGSMVITGYFILKASLGFEVYIPDFTSIDGWTSFLIYELGYTGFFGGIFGLIYSKFYKKIPGKGIKKGLFFGCMIGLLSNIWIAFGEYLTWLFTGLDWYLKMGAIPWTEGFLIWLTYGLVLGPVYERLNL